VPRCELLLLCFSARDRSDIADLQFVLVMKETTLQGHLFRFLATFLVTGTKNMKSWTQINVATTNLASQVDEQHRNQLLRTLKARSQRAVGDAGIGMPKAG